MSVRCVLLPTLLALLVLVFAGWSVNVVLASAPPPGDGEAAGEKHGGSEGHDEKPHEHDPFEELQDSFHWSILPSLGLEFDLPHTGELVDVVYFNGVTKFMILELIVAVLIAAIYIPLAQRLRSGQLPRGAWDHAFESLLTFIRNEVAKPNLGEHDADKYLPFLWTVFLFILFSNLLGMIPYFGSPTANLYVTGALALCSFVVMHGAAVAKMGPVHYLQSQWPHMDIPFGMGYLLKPMIFTIEMLGTVIKGGVLAVRLFANMFAGHTVLAMILGFIVVTGVPGVALWLWGTISGASVLGTVALSLLELFVAFLQSYIFVFLTALFMGMALHPQH
jgi:F-type H+-transporting ATPase subunit a